jgi:hypothetical protein
VLYKQYCTVRFHAYSTPRTTAWYSQLQVQNSLDVLREFTLRFLVNFVAIMEDPSTREEHSTVVKEGHAEFLGSAEVQSEPSAPPHSFQPAPQLVVESVASAPPPSYQRVVAVVEPESVQERCANQSLSTGCIHHFLIY